MADLAGEGILHGLVAAGVIFVLLRLWPGDSPGLRLRFQLLALAFPALLTPALAVLAPWRQGDDFRDSWAIFSSRRLGELRLLGHGLDSWFGIVLALSGSALLLRDLGPFLVEVVGGPRRAEPAGAQLPNPLGAFAAAVEPPPIAWVEGEGPLLLTVGLWRPRIVASRTLLDCLAPEELRAALAHEMAHVARRDPLLGAGLMGLRLLLFFNPAVQVVARAAVQEMERRADDVAVSVTGSPEPLLRGLRTGFREGEGRRVTAEGWPGLDGLGRLLDRFRARAIEARCQRLMGARESAPPQGGLRLGLTAVALASLLFFVV